MILDLAASHVAGLFFGEAGRAAEAAADGALNSLFALGAGPRRALRAASFRICWRMAALRRADGEHAAPRLGLHDRTCRLASATTPISMSAFTTRPTSAKLFRPDNPLLPNYKYVPIGYHGRASSIVVSGTAAASPKRAAQSRAPKPSRASGLAAIWIMSWSSAFGSGPATSSALRSRSAKRRSTWPAFVCSTTGRRATSRPGNTSRSGRSCRKISGPRFQSVGRHARGASPVPYCRSHRAPRAIRSRCRICWTRPTSGKGRLNMELEVLLLTPGLKEKGLPPHRLALSSTRYMYWTVAQMVTHHTCNGCNLRPGDLLGSGTISAPDPSGCGSLLETTEGGKAPVRLELRRGAPLPRRRRRMILRARARREGFARSASATVAGPF